jgi:hypothetical protein
VSLTEAAWASLLVDRDRGGDRVRARALADKARRTASAGGYRSIEQDAIGVLTRLGG